jgi:leader peptidase (prepilin peptidase)/N-methyltransferase
MSPILVCILLFVLGVALGGVVNVLADDLPKRRPVRLPHYPDGTPRPVRAWWGVTALLTRAMRSPGGARLKARTWLTEISLGLLFVITYLVVIDDPKMTLPQFLFWLAYMVIFTLITVIDLEHRLILFVVIIPSAVIALVDAALLGYGADLGGALLGAVLGFVIFFLLYVGGFIFTAILGNLRGEKIEEVAFGYGDVMLITLAGLILGWQALIVAMFITVILGALGAIVYLIVRRLAGRHYSLFTPLPYGQYIIVATILMLLFAPELTQFLRGGA